MYAKILLIDNYDSFTNNLVSLIEEINGDKPVVVMSDKVDLAQLSQYDALVLSPGPGLPFERGKMAAVLQEWDRQKPVLGVCLGHQALALHFGGKLFNAKRVYHGIATTIFPQGESKIFNEMGNFEAGRYHSWFVEKETLPECLQITAVDEHGEIMAIEHKEYPFFGWQFHPESIMTPTGGILIERWLEQV